MSDGHPHCWPRNELVLTFSQVPGSCCSWPLSWQRSVQNPAKQMYSGFWTQSSSDSQEEPSSPSGPGGGASTWVVSSGVPSSGSTAVSSAVSSTAASASGATSASPSAVTSAATSCAPASSVDESPPSSSPQAVNTITATRPSAKRFIFFPLSASDSPAFVSGGAESISRARDPTSHDVTRLSMKEFSMRETEPPPVFSLSIRALCRQSTGAGARPSAPDR